MKQLRADIRAAVVHARHHPTTFVTAVLILAVGLGMAVAMSIVVNGVLLRPLPMVDVASVASFSLVGRGAAAEIPVNDADLTVLQREGHALTQVAGMAHYGAQVFPAFDGETPLVLAQARVTGNFFSLLGGPPLIGRLIVPSDDAAGALPVAVLSYEAWQRQFGGSSTVIGRHVTVEDGTSGAYQIIGVARPGLGLPRGADYWVAVGPTRYHRLALIGRLGPDVKPERAAIEVYSILTRLDAAHPHKSSPASSSTLNVPPTAGGPRVVILVLAVKLKQFLPSPSSLNYRATR
jgi:hypothetical protein